MELKSLKNNENLKNFRLNFRSALVAIFVDLEGSAVAAARKIDVVCHDRAEDQCNIIPFLVLVIWNILSCFAAIPHCRVLWSSCKVWFLNGCREKLQEMTCKTFPGMLNMYRAFEADRHSNQGTRQLEMHVS